MTIPYTVANRRELQRSRAGLEKDLQKLLQRLTTFEKDYPAVDTTEAEAVYVQLQTAIQVKRADISIIDVQLGEPL